MNNFKELSIPILLKMLKGLNRTHMTTIKFLQDKHSSEKDLELCLRLSKEADTYVRAYVKEQFNLQITTEEETNA